jgi:dTDP-3-amino-3,4,6-trideoxy-alpha-D-glucose transaminase
VILLNDFQRQWAETGSEVLATFGCVAASGWYILGPRVKQFEKSLAALWGMNHASGVANGLEAIEIALTALGCRPGDKVLTTPLSAFATTLAILRIGATPVFVDTDAFGLIDLELCRDLLNTRQDIRFFVPVHLYGNSLDLRELGRLQNEFEIDIVEDCAQSILSTFDGVPCGSAGRMAATSFYPTKNLGAMGDGGAILTNDESLKGSIEILRDYGQTGKYRHEAIGWNSRLDEVHAAILNDVYLPRLKPWTHRRCQIARSYLDGIQHPAVRCLGSPRGSHSSWHLFPVLVPPDRKRAFMEWLQSQNVSCAEHYPTAVYRQTALGKASFEIATECATAERICASEVSLPIHPYLTDGEIRDVIQVVNSWRL